MSEQPEDILSKEQETTPEKENVWQQVVNDLLDLLGISDIVNYSSIIKQVAFVCFLILIAIFHIFNSHRAVRMVRDKNKLETEIKELRWEQMSIKSDLLKRSMQSDIEKDIESIGLKSLKTPPYKIVVSKNEN